MNQPKQNKNQFRTVLRILSLLLFIMILLLHGELHILIFKSFEAKYKKEVKQIIKSGIPQELLVFHKFHKNIFEKEIQDFKWIKKNEYRYKNEMYDIIKTEFQNDSVYFYCFHDLKESQLFKNLDKAIAGYLNKNRDKQNDFELTVNSFNKYYFHDYTPQSQIKFTFKKPRNSFRNEKILSGYLSIKTPPPNLFSYS